MKVEGYPDLNRDPNTGAVVNNNDSAYRNYLLKKRRSESEIEDMNSMKNDIDNLKKDISDIKDLLIQIANK
jgi:hypothetical protein